MALADTLAEIDALAEQQREEANRPPPVGSPQRPRLSQPSPLPATPRIAPPAEAPPQPKSFLDKAVDFVRGAPAAVARIAEDPATYEGIGAGIVRAPGVLAGGAADTLSDLDRFQRDNISANFARAPKPLQDALQATSALTPLGALGTAFSQVRKGFGGASLSDVLSNRQGLGQVGNAKINQGAAQFTAVVGSLMSGGGEAEALAKSAPMAAKVARLLVSSLRQGAAAGVTADTTGSATPLRDRGKEAAIGAAVNVVAEPLLGLVHSYIAAKLPTKVTTATAAEAAGDRLDRSFASGRTQEARYQAQETTPHGSDSPAGLGGTDTPSGPTPQPSAQESLARGTRHSDGPGPDPLRNDDHAGARLAGGVDRPVGPGASAAGGPDVQPPVHPHTGLYQDANAALEAAGAAEHVDPASHPLTPDGRIAVDPATKATMDEAGLGRAFTNRDSLPATATTTTTTTPATPRGKGDLWTLSQDELQGLADEKGLSDRGKLVQALGSPEAATEFERLDRARNSSDPARADPAAKLFDEKFGNLTPEQERLVYGVGETDAQAHEIQTVLQAHSDVMPGDSEGWLSYMAAVAARKTSVADLMKVPEGGASAEAQASYVRMQRAYDGLAEQGVAPGDIPRRMAEALVDHAGWRPEQAEEVIGGFVSQMREAGAAKARALPSPMAAHAEGPDPVIFKETDEAGGARVVGMIGKEDLQGFKDDVAAIRLEGETAIDTDAAHPAGQWKLGNLGAPYDVGPFLRGLADQLPAREKLTDADLMAAAKANADAIGWNPADMVAYAASVAGDAHKLPEVMATIRTVYARAAIMVDSLADAEIDWSAVPDTHPRLTDTLQAVHNVINLSQAVADFKSGVGGALRAAGLPDADSYLESFGKVPEGQLKPVDPLDGLPKLPRTKDELKQWMDAWSYTKGDPGLRDTFLKGLTFMPGKWLALRTSFANFFTAGIISAPATFMRDLLGPMIIGGLRTVERTSGGIAVWLTPWVDAPTKQEALRAALIAPKAYFETIGDMGDALKAAVRAYQSGSGLLTPHNGYDLLARTIPQGLIDAATERNPGVTGSIPHRIANAMNLFPQWIHALHGGVNELAQRLSYLGEVRASAYLEAGQKGLTGDDLQGYVRDRLLNSTDEVTWAGNDASALASSERTTLIKPVGGPRQPVVSSFADSISKLRMNFPESRYVLPIFTVPANALGEGLRRVPILGQIFSETRRELLGEAGAAVQAEAYGRFLTGAAFMGGGFAMARLGMITGAGPQQPKDREVWEAQGFQPYSIRMGDQWVSYNRLDVVGNLLAIPATIFDRSVHTQQDNQSAVYAGVAAMAEYFKDQAALQGLSDLMSFGGSPQESQSFLKRLGNQTLSGFVPNFITQLGRNNLDPGKRVVRNPWEAILNKIPGASQLLDPQRNPLGEDVMKVQNAGYNLLPVSLTTANTYAKDPIVDELDRLYQVTGYAPGIKSPMLRGGKVDMRDVKLEDGHSLYDAIVRYRSDPATVNGDGQTLRQALQTLIDSPEYADAVDGDASSPTTTAGDQDRGAMVQKVFLEFNKLSEQGVATDSPIAARYMAIAAIKQGNNAVLRDHPTEELANNPALLRSLGINLQDFEDKVRGDNAAAF